MNPVDHLATVLDSTAALVAAVPPDRWTAPTPCPEWNARELVGHVVLGNRLFADVLRGSGEAHSLDPKQADVLGDDPAATYRRAADALVAAFRLPGALDRVIRVPAGEVPGIAALHLRIVEEVTHGWDLAEATGQQPKYPDDVVAPEVAFTRAKLADVPPGRSPFAPAVPVADDAPPLHQLVALLGRTPR
ncbi:TIGR03086 family metal-binding protein [Amycolatopsis jejuensis]|uniref:TIGR03086 family metal-binding protein n=1 Tax=Amycolatopsis jejuensis TaxID=330084 RepID=UPI000526797B|nr:TIGR03086 family metal-binding protein [Amycolatopsis jejuensis]